MTDLMDELHTLGTALATNLTNKGVTASYTDGLTTLANKILTIPQSGGHCYGVMLDATSIIGIQGTGTVGVTIYDNYSPVSNASLTLTGSDNSTYSATTNSSGYATFTTSGTTGNTITYTLTYQGVTKTCTVQYVQYYWYDTCASDNTSNYTSQSIRNGSGSATLVFNSNESAYACNKSASGYALMQFGDLVLRNNMKVSADIKIGSTSWQNNGFLGFADKDNPRTTYALGGFAQGETYYRMLETNANTEVQTTTNSKWSSLSTSDYNHHEMSYQNGVVSYTITTPSNATKTISLTLQGTNYIGGKVGLWVECNTSPNCYIKNIVAEPIV